MAFQQSSGLEASGKLDEASWGKLTTGAAEPVVAAYKIAAADQKGPFVDKIPHDYEKMAELKYLGYRGPREALAEKFHMDEDLLKALNPHADFDQVGESIVVAAKVSEPRQKSVREASAGKQPVAGMVPSAGESDPALAEREEKRSTSGGAEIAALGARLGGGRQHHRALSGFGRQRGKAGAERQLRRHGGSR